MNIKSRNHVDSRESCTAPSSKRSRLLSTLSIAACSLGLLQQANVVSAQGTVPDISAPLVAPGINGIGNNPNPTVTSIPVGISVNSNALGSLPPLGPLAVGDIGSVPTQPVAGLQPGDLLSGLSSGAVPPAPSPTPGIGPSVNYKVIKTSSNDIYHRAGFSLEAPVIGAGAAIGAPLPALTLGANASGLPRFATIDFFAAVPSTSVPAGEAVVVGTPDTTNCCLAVDVSYTITDSKGVTSDPKAVTMTPLTSNHYQVALDLKASLTAKSVLKYSFKYKKRDESFVTTDAQVLSIPESVGTGAGTGAGATPPGIPAVSLPIVGNSGIDLSTAVPTLEFPSLGGLPGVVAPGSGSGSGPGDLPSLTPPVLSIPSPEGIPSSLDAGKFETYVMPTSATSISIVVDTHDSKVKWCDIYTRTVATKDLKSIKAKLSNLSKPEVLDFELAQSISSLGQFLTLRKDETSFVLQSLPYVINEANTLLYQVSCSTDGSSAAVGPIKEYTSSFDSHIVTSSPNPATGIAPGLSPGIPVISSNVNGGGLLGPNSGSNAAGTITGTTAISLGLGVGVDVFAISDTLLARVSPASISASATDDTLSVRNALGTDSFTQNSDGTTTVSSTVVGEASRRYYDVIIWSPSVSVSSGSIPSSPSPSTSPAKDPLTWCILHYWINGKQQMHIQMSKIGATFEAKRIPLAPKDILEFSFTYQLDPSAAAAAGITTTGSITSERQKYVSPAAVMSASGNTSGLSPPIPSSPATGPGSLPSGLPVPPAGSDPISVISSTLASSGLAPPPGAGAGAGPNTVPTPPSGSTSTTNPVVIPPSEIPSDACMSCFSNCPQTLPAPLPASTPSGSPTSTSNTSPAIEKCWASCCPNEEKKMTNLIHTILTSPTLPVVGGANSSSGGNSAGLAPPRLFDPIPANVGSGVNGNGLPGIPGAVPTGFSAPAFNVLSPLSLSAAEKSMKTMEVGGTITRIAVESGSENPSDKLISLEVPSASTPSPTANPNGILTFHSSTGSFCVTAQCYETCVTNIQALEAAGPPRPVSVGSTDIAGPGPGTGPDPTLIAGTVNSISSSIAAGATPEEIAAIQRAAAGADVSNPIAPTPPTPVAPLASTPTTITPGALPPSLNLPPAPAVFTPSEKTCQQACIAPCSGPTAPTAPAAPTAPVAPTAPTAPVPVAPVAPVAPTAPVAPAPVAPVAPTPVTPTGSTPTTTVNRDGSTTITSVVPTPSTPIGSPGPVPAPAPVPGPGVINAPFNVSDGMKFSTQQLGEMMNGMGQLNRGLAAPMQAISVPLSQQTIVPAFSSFAGLASTSNANGFNPSAFSDLISKFSSTLKN